MISECERSYYLFDGNCFTTCPEKTFLLPERAPAAGNVRSKGLSLKRRAANVDEFDSLRDLIGNTETLVRNRAIMTSSSPQKLCGSCHDSCSTCKGPLDSDCIRCDENYNRIDSGSSVSCKPNKSTPIKNSPILKIILVCLLITVTLALITCISIRLLRRKRDSDKASLSERDKNFSGKYSYNQLSANEEILLTRLADNDAPDAESDNESDG